MVPAFHFTDFIFSVGKGGGHSHSFILLSYVIMVGNEDLKLITLLNIGVESVVCGSHLGQGVLGYNVQHCRLCRTKLEPTAGLSCWVQP